MIRRDVYERDSVSDWVLISQIEHARISAQLAHGWGNAQLAAMICSQGAPLADVRREVLATIRHHDDGWRDWSGHPDLDASGRPRAFTEMPLDQALPIWSESVTIARSIGPLAAWMVAGHFSALLASSERSRQQAARVWLSEQARARAAWLAAWQALDPVRHTQGLAASALGWLQLFDAMSLWICLEAPVSGECRPHPPPYRLKLPDDSTVTLCIVNGTAETPGAQSPSAAQTTIQPWPFPAADLTVEAAGATVTARGYRSTAELVDSRQPLRLRWHLSAQPAATGPA